MKIFRARFFWGFVVGFIVGPVAALGFVYGYNKVQQPSAADRIKPPAFLPMTLDAEYDWALETLAGDPFHFSELKGKVVFLTVWRAGCEFCEAELPFLQNLYDKTGEDGFAFVAVAEKDDRIVDLVAEYDLTFPIYTYEGERPKVYTTGIVPSTFILSPEGKVAFRFRGASRWDDDTCVAFMRELAQGGVIGPLGLEEERGGAS